MARDALNAQVGRGSPGRHAKVGDLIMVKEADSSLARQGVHPKLSHDHWTAPWKVVGIPRPGSSLVVNPNGRSIRRRIVSVANVKPFYLRPVDLRHKFKTSLHTLPGDQTWVWPKRPQRRHPCTLCLIAKRSRGRVTHGLGNTGVVIKTERSLNG